MKDIIADYFKDKRVLVTGGTGLIGKSVVKKLCDFGSEVTIISLDKSNTEKRAKHIVGDL